MGLRINNLTKSFGKDVKISNFSYNFPDIGVFAIIGESGVGKTTLARLIAGLDTDYSGEITGGGIGNVSVAFQEYRLFPHISALDNVIIPNYSNITSDSLNLATNMLAMLGFNQAEMGLKPSALSGGMKQRVSLARAFLNDAPILILDEATKELDVALKEKVLEIIAEEAKMRLVILITHDITEAKKLNADIIELKK